VCFRTPACHCIPRSRATHPRLSALPSSSIPSTVESTYLRIVASSVARCPVVVQSHVMGYTPKVSVTVLVAHPHCCC
jgi:hypothetical protein